jgi:stage IV sporulation protein FB
MRDPFAWSLPLGRVLGVIIRVHVTFFIFVIVMWLKKLGPDSRPGEALAMLVLMLLLFVSVLLHEFGHCFAARYVDGEASEVLLWPLGGLARCEVPHSAWAHFVTAAGGPMVNLLLCMFAGIVLAAMQFQPSFNPLPEQCWNTYLRSFDGGFYGSDWAVKPPLVDKMERLPQWIHLTAQFFWVNWFMFLLNVLLCGFPLDGGRMLQAVLWPRLGYRSAMRTAIFVGFVVMFIAGVYALVKEELLVLCLAGAIYVGCKQEWITLDMGGDESLFGYDFSQGYTSLERDQPAPKRKRKPNFLQRWLQRRAAKKLQRQQEQQEADERRMDELLDKIAREGMQALTDEENRFLKRVAEDRNRHRP